MSTNISKRAGFLLDMNDILTKCCQDEDLLETWFSVGCPDGLDLDEALEIADCIDDQDYISTLEMFVRVLYRSLRTHSFLPCDLR